MQFFECITDFIFKEDQPQEADMIMIPGSICPELAYHAAKLYHQGMAPYILPSGRYSILKGQLELSEQELEEVLAADRLKLETESDYLCALLRKCGVPEHALIPEKQATYTYENAVYSRKKLEEMQISVRRVILCCQAFHARRSLMYYQEQFPQTEILVCPVVTKGISRDSWYQTEVGIDTVLGEVERCGTQFHEIMRQHMELR